MKVTGIWFVRIWVGLLMAGLALAQDLQSRTLVQVGLDFNKQSYVALKAVLNAKSQTPDNANFFLGLGYRGESWTLEELIKKQWSPAGGTLTLDARFLKKFGNKGKTILYVETEPFLNKKAFGWSSSLDTEVWKKFSLGIGTENINKLGPDITSAEGRFSRRIGRLYGFESSVTLAARFDPLRHAGPITGHPHEVRLYLIFTKRIALADRK